MPPDRKPLDPTAFGLMTLLCMLWGLQQVAIKLTAPDVSLVMQAGIRSVVATLLLMAWARLRGIALFGRDRTLVPGLVAGAMFAAEFVFIYAGLAHTTAARMVVFIYVTPCLTALLLPAFVPSARASGRACCSRSPASSPPSPRGSCRRRARRSAAISTASPPRSAGRRRSS
jgi:drug/metabolite transporter (DMT)-like permease